MEIAKGLVLTALIIALLWEVHDPHPHVSANVDRLVAHGQRATQTVVSGAPIWPGYADGQFGVRYFTSSREPGADARSEDERDAT